MEDSIPKDPELVIPIMVDLKLPITEEVVMHRRINGPDFQEQLDDIDAELTKFDNGREKGWRVDLGKNFMKLIMLRQYWAHQ